MRVKMLAIDAGPAGVRQPGDVVDVEGTEGAALIAGGFAVAVDPAPKKSGRGRAPSAAIDGAPGEPGGDGAGASTGEPGGDAASPAGEGGT